MIDTPLLLHTYKGKWIVFIGHKMILFRQKRVMFKSCPMQIWSFFYVSLFKLIPLWNRDSNFQVLDIVVSPGNSYIKENKLFLVGISVENP